MMTSEGIWPEPAPKWPQAKKVWKWGWEFHVFGFAFLFILVALYSLFIVFSQRKFYLKRKKLHALFLNLMLLISSVTRATALLWNPYGSEESSKAFSVLSVILFGLGTSCLTSAFSVLLLMLLETTKISLVSPLFQKFPILIGIWTINVIYILASDLTVVHFRSAKAMIFVCQLMLAVWGLVISVGYAVTVYKIRRNLSSSRETSQYNSHLSSESARMHKLIVLLSVASLDGFCLFVMSIYTACSDTGVFNEGGEVEIWPWFGIQTALRVTELVMCVLIFMIALSSGSRERRLSHNVIRDGTSLQTRGDLMQSRSIGCNNEQ